MELAHVAEPEPMDKNETIRIASFGFVLATNGETAHSDYTLEKVRETILKPIFVRASNEIKRDLNEEIEIKIVSVENGSLIIEAYVLASILLTSSGVAAVASGVLTNIITKNIYSTSDEKQYEILNKKLKVICKAYALEAESTLNDRERYRAFLTLPNSETEIRDFYFSPESYEDARFSVDQALANYHNAINKP